MTLDLDRRLLLKAGTLGLGALAVPGIAQIAAARGFTHGVASGEPRQRSVMLWTRYVPGGRLALAGVAHAGLRQDRRRGRGRRRGRARLLRQARRHRPRARHLVSLPLPRRPRRRLRRRPHPHPARRAGRRASRLGIFSCANLAFGYFNAYAHAAARRDLDLLVHLGDYFYEFERGKYPSAREALAGRILEPAQARRSRSPIIACATPPIAPIPDLQRLHASAPMVMMWDDHETANDSWSGGAENHDPGEGGAVGRPQGRRAARLSRMAAGLRQCLGELRDRRSRHPVPPRDPAHRAQPPARLCRGRLPRRGPQGLADALPRRRLARSGADDAGLRAGGLAGRRVQALGGAGDSLAIARPADGDGRAGRFRSRRAPGFAPTRPRQVTPGDRDRRRRRRGRTAAQPRRLGRLSRRPRPAAPLRPRRRRQPPRPLRRQPQWLGLRPRPRRHPGRRRVRRLERHLARPRSLCAGSRPRRGRARRPRPQPRAQMGRPPAPRLS